MKFKPVISNRVNPAKLGIEVENEEISKIKESVENNGGSVDLAEVYEVPLPVENNSKNKTLNKYLEREGLEYTEKQYQREYQLKVAHQVMINGGTTAQIATTLNITLNAAKELKRELTSRQIAAIKKMNVEEEVAKAYMFYDHVAAKALQLSNKQLDGKAGVAGMRNQIEALKVALQAQTDKQKFLALAGAYQNGVKNGEASDRHVDGAANLRDMLSGVLEGGVYQAVPEEETLEDGIEIL